LIEIYLQNKLDRYCLFKSFKAGLHAFIKNGVVELSLASDRLIIKVDETFEFEETIKPVVTEILKKHVIETKEEVWLLDIIHNIFFYDDPEEQTQILAMAKSILAGERLDLPNVSKVFSTEKIIYDAFMEFLTRNCEFCYESFLTFRLKSYLDKLIDCVEMSIDEYQLEHEYQNLVESFRYYLKKRTPKIGCIHVVIDTNYSFYDEYLQVINEEQLKHYLDREIIFEKGIPIKEMIISPLVSIAPKEIHLYSDEIDNGVIHSIQNIFQERVKLYSKDFFEKIAIK
jgi:putative sporulation protein YtxC